MSRIALAMLALGAAAAPAAPRATSASPPAAEPVESRGFRVHYTPRAAGLAGPLALLLEKGRDELARRMGRDFEGTADVYLAEGPDEARAIAPESLLPPPWAAGAAVPGANALLFDARSLRGDEGKQLVLHELAHLALGRLGPGSWPRWFQEGFAMLVAGEWSMSRYAALYRATFKEAALPFAALSERWPERLPEVEVAYAQSASFVAQLYEEHGEAKLRELIARAAGGADFAASFELVYGVRLERAEADWRASLVSHYRWLPVAASPSALGLFASAVLFYAYARARRKRRERLEAMELEERAQEAAARIAAAERARQLAAEPGTSEEGPESYLN